MREFPLKRRQVLATAGAVGPLASLIEYAGTADANVTSATPEEARTVEKGLSEFVAKWEAFGVPLLLTRFGRFLEHTYNIHVTDTVQSYTLRLEPAGATLNPGLDPGAHATVAMPEDAWLGVLYGEQSGFAPLMLGDLHLKRDEQNKGAALTTAMYIISHLPATLELDDYTRLLESCEGEPTAFERPEQLIEDPQRRIEEETLGDAGAPPLTRTVSEWVCDLSYDDIPESEIRTAKRQLLSTLGIIYAASTMPACRTFVERIEAISGGGEASVVGMDSFQTTPRDAAMVNSYLAQMLEWEDWVTVAHTGAAVVPAALAAAEAADASGEELLTAIVAANEVLSRLGDLCTDVLNTGQALAVHQAGTPLVAGKLFGLDASSLQDALGIATVQPQVTSIPSWVADAKGMISAEPVHTSMRAVRLAEAGISGRRDQLENPLGYLYRTSDIRHVNELETRVDELGHEWHFSSEFFDKRYPTDGFQLTTVHAALGVREQLLHAGVDPSDPAEIEHISVGMNILMSATGTMFNGGDPEALLERINSSSKPDWTYTALLFDGYYPIAAALVDGELTHRQYLPDRLSDPAIRDLCTKMEHFSDISYGAFGSEVRVRTASGDVLTSSADIGVGDESDYNSVVECIREGVNADYTSADKFRETAGTVLDEPEPVISAVESIESYDTVSDFTALL